MVKPYTFKTGTEAMDFLLGRSSPPDDPPKSTKQLESEIAEALATPLKKTRAKSSRTPATAKRAASSSGRQMTGAEYLASLPPPLDLQGNDAPSEAMILQRIRDEVNGAAKAGAVPAGTKFGVRKRHYKAFTVEITEWPGAVLSEGYQEHLLDPKGTPWNPRYDRAFDAMLSPELNDALKLIERIAERHNYTDRTDPYADYSRSGYYMTVTANPVIAAARQGLALESNKEFSKLFERAKVAAKALGPAATKSVCGKKSLERAGDYCLGQLIKLAERAGGRPVKYDKRMGAWLPVGPEKASHLRRASKRPRTSRARPKSRPSRR